MGENVEGTKARIGRRHIKYLPSLSGKKQLTNHGYFGILIRRHK